MVLDNSYRYHCKSMHDIIIRYVYALLIMEVIVLILALIRKELLMSYLVTPSDKHEPRTICHVVQKPALTTIACLDHYL